MAQDKLGVVEFSRFLVETGDLDPLYIALHKSGMNHHQLCRWLVAYWCYYHAGLCCWISEQPSFFQSLLDVARGGTDYPRGSERRHFRGKFAETAVIRLGQEFDSASSLVSWLSEAGPSAGAIMKRVKSLYGFGEWISWKVPDMIERLGLAPITFAENDLDLMFDSSLKGAEEVWNHHSENIDADAGRRRRWAHRYLLNRLAPLRAPPRYERALNVQETETLFCKWKSHLGGHYPLGKDTIEIRHGLLRYAKCKTAQRMRVALAETHQRVLEVTYAI